MMTLTATTVKQQLLLRRKLQYESYRAAFDFPAVLSPAMRPVAWTVPFELHRCCVAGSYSLLRQPDPEAVRAEAGQCGSQKNAAAKSQAGAHSSKLRGASRGFSLLQPPRAPRCPCACFRELAGCSDAKKTGR
jgi:hypothetical protein